MKLNPEVDDDGVGVAVWEMSLRLEAARAAFCEAQALADRSPVVEALVDGLAGQEKARGARDGIGWSARRGVAQPDNSSPAHGDGPVTRQGGRQVTA